MAEPVVTGRKVSVREPSRAKKIRILQEKYRLYKIRASEYADLADQIWLELRDDYGITVGVHE